MQVIILSEIWHIHRSFEAAEDGIVEQPRIISGAVIDDYMELAAVSELNMHFVNTQFYASG